MHDAGYVRSKEAFNSHYRKLVAPPVSESEREDAKATPPAGNRRWSDAEDKAFASIVNGCGGGRGAQRVEHARRERAARRPRTRNDPRPPLTPRSYRGQPVWAEIIEALAERGYADRTESAAESHWDKLCT